MSIPKTPGRLTLDLKKYDKQQGRLLSNELKDIDAIRDRQVWIIMNQYACKCRVLSPFVTN